LLGHDQVLNLELPLGIIGMHPILEWDVFIKFPNQSFTISIEQIPIIHTFIFIINKCQRLTLSRPILGPLLHPSQQNLFFKWHIIYSSITSETFGRLVNSWTPFPYCFRIQPRNIQLTKDKCLHALEHIAWCTCLHHVLWENKIIIIIWVYL
jgi:hypothetical protein